MTQALCIIGNKRSGSTHLMELLNLHPNIFISNESDIIWILYRFHNNQEITPYPWDTPVGMDKTLEQYETMLSKEKTPLENFLTIQKAIMENGFIRMKPMHKENLKWVGDQKPFQQIDPDIVPFIKTNFPGFKFLHLIRHPAPVIRSSKVFKGGVLWKGMSEDDILARWTMHEEWVNLEKQKNEIPMLDVKYEDIVNNTAKTTANMFDFLEVDYDKTLLKEAERTTKRDLKFHPSLKYPPKTVDIMAQYGYETRNPFLGNKTFVDAVNFLGKVKKKLLG
jgi:hypothetical protein